jgi:hypothetical protein
MDTEKADKFNIGLDTIEASPVAPALQEPEPYTPSSDDIAFLQKQVTISTDHARQLLLKNNGNYVNAIVDFYQVKYTADTIGIAESSHKQLDISNGCTPIRALQSSRVLTLETVSQCQLNTIPRTYLYVVLNNNYNGFTKKKKYGTLANIVTELVEPGIKAEHARYDILAKHINQTLPINIRELTGNCTEVLDKWSLPSAGITFYPGQVFANNTIIELGLIGFLNKNGTQLARYSGIIQENESIIGEAYVISNVEFN